MGTAGKKCRVSFSDDGSAGTFSVIQGVKSVSHTLESGTVDDSEMGSEYVQSIAGLLGGKISLSCNRRLADANGQNAILAAMLAGTDDIWVKVLPDNGVTNDVGFQQKVVITKFASDAAVDGGQGLSIEFQGTGEITLVP